MERVAGSETTLRQGGGVLAVGLLAMTVATVPATAGGLTQSSTASSTRGSIGAPRASLGSVTATVINPSDQTNPLSHSPLQLQSVTTPPNGTAVNPVVTVDPGDTAQKITGFGASLTGEAANVIWNHLSTTPGSSGGTQGCPSSDSMRTCILQSFFNPTFGCRHLPRPHLDWRQRFCVHGALHR